MGSFDDNPIFVHSSMFIDDLLPMAKVGLISIDEKNKITSSMLPSEQLKYLTEIKKYKKIKYITLDIYRKYIQSARFTDLGHDLYHNVLYLEDGIIASDKHHYEIINELRVHNNHSVIEDDKKLYYDDTLYTLPSLKFCIYVKTDDIDYVKSIFKYAPYFGFGNRVSVGKNCFRFIEAKELLSTTNITDYRLLLSKCVFDEFDLEESSYVLDSQLYMGSKYYESNRVGRINKFVEGSYMKVKVSKDYYGQLLECNNGKSIYHYGIGFVI